MQKKYSGLSKFSSEQVVGRRIFGFVSWFGAASWRDDVTDRFMGGTGQRPPFHQALGFLHLKWGVRGYCVECSRELVVE